MIRTRIFLLIVIMVLAAFFRFWHIAETPPGLYPDEAMNGNNAVEALNTGEFKIFYPENNGREGLFINMQALSVWLFGNEPWALRVVSALFGTLTVLGIYLLTRELFHKDNFQFSIFNFQFWKLEIGNSELIALLSSFFLATNFWHINFSRIGFRAILVPFFLVWSFYFLYRMIRSLREETPQSYKPELFAIAGGILFGLGFHTYIAYRLAPFLLVPPFIFALSTRLEAELPNRKCSPCILVLFLFVALVAALPMGYYFLQHPEDFVGRTGQVSAFTTDFPLRVIGLNILKTIGMFFWAGDYNWRHNYAGAPMLWLPVAFLFLFGIMKSFGDIIQNDNVKFKDFRFLTVTFRFTLYILHCLATPLGFLLVWLTTMSLPAIISNEGIPHALRTIGMIPPTMILVAYGFVWLVEKVQVWLKEQKKCWPDYTAQLTRISWELSMLAMTLLLALPMYTVKQYFFDWGNHEETRNAFSEPYAVLGRELAKLPPELPKYVIVNADGALVHGIPMPAQTVMFIAEGGIATRGVPTPRNIMYILPEDEKMLETIKTPYVAVRLHQK